MKNLFLIFLSFIIIAGCQRNEVIKTHGISFLNEREKLIVVNKSNKNDTTKILGQPSTRGMTDNNVWIYIERTKTRATPFKLGKDYLKKNNVLVLEFDKYGIVSKKEFYDKDKMKKVTFAKSITENEIRKENFVVGFLSSIRQKMESRRK